MSALPAHGWRWVLLLGLFTGLVLMAAACSEGQPSAAAPGRQAQAAASAAPPDGQRGLGRQGTAPQAASSLGYTSSRALVIGVSIYRNGWPELQGVAEDVAAVTQALQRQGFEVENLNNPTAKELDAALHRFTRERANDTQGRVVIYFAGHGYTQFNAHGDGRGYLVGADAPRHGLQTSDPSTWGVDMDDFRRAAQSMSARHALFVLDACFSGTVFAQPVITRGLAPSAQELMAQPARLFITAGTHEQKVPDRSLLRAAFVQAISTPVADLNADGFVAGQEVAAYVLEHVKKNVHGSIPHDPQWGVLKGALYRGDILFAAQRTQAPPPPPEPLRAQDCTHCPELVEVPSLQGPQGQALWVAASEVTQAQWQALMATQPSAHADCPECPVERVSWADAQRYAQALSKHTGKAYRLPTDAEWDRLVAASGAPAPHSPAALSQKTVPVSRLPANALGMRGLDGNVREWTSTAQGAVMAFVRGEASNTSQASTPPNLAARLAMPQTSTEPTVGFRVVRE